MKIKHRIIWNRVPKYSQLRFIGPTNPQDLELREPWMERMVTQGSFAGHVRISFAFTQKEADELFEFNRQNPTHD